MKIFLAGQGYIDCERISSIIKDKHPFVLQSFFYITQKMANLIPSCEDFMLDSGAFTFMGGFSFTKNEQKKVNFDDYIERYAQFILKHNVAKFFELDVDSVVGYDQVKKYRKKLEKLTNRQSIPVWHSTRGIDDFIKMCEEYPYVAIGGIVGGEWNVKAEKTIPWFISEAHRRGAQIHGLGFTKLEKLKYLHFDSVDSTSWLSGNQFGRVFVYRDGTLNAFSRLKQQRIKDPESLAVHNFSEWLKFQEYAKKYL